VSSYGVALGVRPGGKSDQVEDSTAVDERPVSTPGRREPRVFQAAPDSIAARIADRCARRHPVVAGAVAFVLGYLALAIASITLGVLLIEVVLTGTILSWDNGVVDWLAEHRTPRGVDVSWVGSHLAETGTVLAVVGVVTLILCLHRRFVAMVFFVAAIAAEGATYLATTLVIDRPRPHVARFENLGSGASYPSGHTAASVVIYVGIAILVFAYVRNGPARVAAIVLAIVAPIAVALARMYRGMHHPIDVISGALIGVGCLLVGLLVARVFNTVTQRYREEARS
jgi:membrane-associated phospholipid phosphatase